MITVFWFRRDLRWTDNCGLWQAFKTNYPVLPIFIFDYNILSILPSKQDRRINFIYNQLLELQKQLDNLNKSLAIFSDKPIEVFKKLTTIYPIFEVYCNRDYEPYSRQRDEEISAYLHSKDIPFKNYKDQVIFEKNEVLSPANLPYKVFSQYAKQWKLKLAQEPIKYFSSEKYLNKLLDKNSDEPQKITLEELGFSHQSVDITIPPLPTTIIENYHKNRDYPGLTMTSKLSVHLRFGTLSIRQVVAKAVRNDFFLNELIWREFFMMLLFHFPKLVTNPFKPNFENLPWLNNKIDFAQWCQGQTGFTFIDAGMVELNETGYMPNRVRMVAASFLCKQLLIDWRWGEAYFATKLLDFELASNNGNWQWVAGCGVDAAPYFRLFNPEIQQLKFDPDNTYSHRWLSPHHKEKYPNMIDLKFARNRALDFFKKNIINNEFKN